MYRPLYVAAAVAITLLFAALGLPKPFTQAQTETEIDPMPTFPNVSGRNIDGVSFSLPYDFEGEYNVVLLVFTQQQQAKVYPWVDVLRPLEDENDAIRVYELPTLPQFNWFMRQQTDYWMSAGISDPLARATTITLYTDVGAIQEAVGFEDTNDIYLILVDREGNIYWHTTGAYTEEKLADLTEVLNSLGEPAQ